MKLDEIKKPEAQELYSMQQVADFIGIHYGTLYRMVKCGKIKALNIARTGKKPIYRFAAEDVQSYYNSLSHSAPRSQSINE